MPYDKNVARGLECTVETLGGDIISWNPCGEQPFVNNMEIEVLKNRRGDDGMYANGRVATNTYTEDLLREVFGVWGKPHKLTNQEKMNPDNIKRVIFNFPATIVIYKDDTKMVVKCNDEEFDEEKGLAMIFMNLAFDNNRSARKRFVDNAIDGDGKGVK